MLLLKSEVDLNEQIREDILEMWKIGQNLDGEFHCDDGTVRFSKLIMSTFSPFLKTILESEDKTDVISLPEFRTLPVETVIRVFHGYSHSIQVDLSTFQQIMNFLQIISVNSRSLCERFNQVGIKREFDEVRIEKRAKIEDRHRKIFYTSKSFTDWSNHKNKRKVPGDNGEPGSYHVFHRVNYIKSYSGTSIPQTALKPAFVVTSTEGSTEIDETEESKEEDTRPVSHHTYQHSNLQGQNNFEISDCVLKQDPADFEESSTFSVPELKYSKNSNNQLINNDDVETNAEADNDGHGDHSVENVDLDTTCDMMKRTLEKILIEKEVLTRDQGDSPSRTETSKKMNVLSASDNIDKNTCNDSIITESLMNDVSEATVLDHLNNLNLATSHMFFKMDAVGKIEYECKICQLKSCSQEHVAKHVLLVHFNVLARFCGVCDLQFTSSQDWEVHIERAHTSDNKQCSMAKGDDKTDAKDLDILDQTDEDEVKLDDESEENEDKLDETEEHQEKWYFHKLNNGHQASLELNESVVDLISSFHPVVQRRLDKEGVHENVFVSGAEHPLMKINYSTLEKIYNAKVMSYEEAVSQVAHTIFRNSQTNKYECTICEGEYQSEKMLLMQSHVFQHFNIYIHRCPYCFDVFRTKKGLETHMENHGFDQQERQSSQEMLGSYHLAGPAVYLEPRAAKSVVESYFSVRGTHGYKCLVCGVLLAGYHKIYNHCLGAHLRINCFSCDICDQKFKLSLDLTKHRRTEHDTSVCDYEKDVETDFPLVEDLSKLPMETLKKRKINHVQEKSLRGLYVTYNTGLKQWECELCTLKSQYRTTIQNHVYVQHYQVYIYKCAHCGDYFNNHNQIIVHRKTLHDNKNKTKGKVLVNTTIEYDKLTSPLYLGEESGRQAAKLYITQDSSDKINLCKLCDFKNSQSSQVMMHVLAKHLLHVYLYRCEECGKQFRYNRNLFKQHELTHSKAGKMQCPHCALKPLKHKKKTVYNKRALNHHIKLYHTEGKYSCATCTDVDEFKTKHDLMIHQAEYHDKRKENRMFECGICEYQFPTRTRLKKHVKRCEAGRSRILFRKQISDILVYLGKGSYKCAFCHQEFHPHPNDPLKAGLPEARNHVVVKHGMRHMRKLKMQWHGDPASVDKTVAYKDKSSIWFQKYKDMEKANNVTLYEKTKGVCLDDSYRALLETLSSEAHEKEGQEGSHGNGGNEKEIDMKSVSKSTESKNQNQDKTGDSVIFQVLSRQPKEKGVGGLGQVYAGNQSNANQIQSSELLAHPQQDDTASAEKEFVINEEIVILNYD